MSETLTSNQAFLQSSVRWIRAVLEAKAESVTSPSETRGWWRSRRSRPAHEASPAQRARAVLDAAAAQAGVPFTTLAERFGLSSFERDVLLLAACAEIDTGIPALIAKAQGDPARPFPTFALAMSLFSDPGWDAMSPARPLRAQQLIEMHPGASVSVLTAPLQIDERIASHIKGVNYLDERLAAVVAPMLDTGPLPPAHEALAQGLARWFSTPNASGVVQLVGAHVATKADIVARAAALARFLAYSTQADALPASVEELGRFARLWSREARLQPLILFVEGVDAVEPLTGEDSRTPAHPRWPRVLARMLGLGILDVRQPLAGLDTAAVIAVDPPSDMERRTRWHEALSIGDQPPLNEIVVRLAGEFTTSGSQIDLAAHRAHAFAAEGGDDPADRVAAAAAHAWGDCVQRAGATLAGITRWVQPRVTIDDVKLPASDKEQLARLIRHARQRSVVSGQFGFDGRTDRGLGITALFHGESGTGKTFAAEAVAHALSLGLAVVDLATVTSKYIGETQKNLRRIFDAADHGGAVLCFDEADALFGRRSDIKDSHDRYANAEINYLLMRMEHFKGVAILATNQKHALDSAFMRRLRFVIGFPFPGVEERSAIWRTVFPPQTPVEDLDYERLARFALSGGGIFSAALAAAHDAAADGQPVSMHHVLEAVRAEMRKLERPISEAEFRIATTAREHAEVMA